MPPRQKTPPAEREKPRRGPKGEGSLYLRGHSWWYKVDGQRFPTGTRIKSEATDFKIRKLAELRVGGAEARPHIKPLKARPTTVNELLDAHLAHMFEQNRQSANNVASVLAKHVRPHFGDRNAAVLTTADFREYREVKTAQKLSPASINRHLAYLRAGYITGLKRVTPRMVDFIPSFPMVDESYNVRQGFLTFDGYEKVLATLPVSLKPLFVCAFHVSSRKGELQNILWSQVDLAEGLIVLDSRETKNRTGRALPIYGDMVNALADQKKLRDADFPDCQSVFFWHVEDVLIGHGGTRSIPGSAIKKFHATWSKAVKAAGFPSLLFHDLRRTAERNMAKAGMDQAMRMKISGHKTPSMSIRYNILTAADIAAEKTKMDEWFKEQKAKTKKI